MSNRFLHKFIIVILVMFVYGCKTSGVQVRTYFEDKKRLDQGLSGNAGYLTGSSKDTLELKKPTRKVYVVEVATKDKIPSGLTKEERKYQKDIPQELLRESRKRAKKMPEPSHQQEIQIPSFDDIEDEIEGKKDKDFVSTSVVEYKVEKNDTLQKISRKFYGSYSKWPRIYENNKELIADPNHIKPGITILIPIE